MKIGVRTPSVRRSISARTTGRAKRKLKKLVNPFYGKKGMGWINNPKKALYNKVYRKTTVSAKGLAKSIGACFYAVFWFIFIIYKYVFIGAWYVLKFIACAVWWLVVQLYNGCLWIYAKLTDSEIEDVETEAENEPPESEYRPHH